MYLKDGLIITGEDSSLVIINTGFGNTTATMIHYTEVSNLKCTEFSLTMGPGAATIVIRKCRFQFAGFSSNYGYTFIVENCISDVGIGNSSGECYLFIRNNKILNGTISDRGGALPGIEAHIIENNVINNNGFIDPGESVILARSSSITLLNNIIECNGQGSGIDVSTGPPTNIIGNDIILNNGNPLNGTVGIITSSGAGVVTDNNIIGGWVGYYSKSGATLFENNTITQAHTGFFSLGAEEVKNNTITNCSGDGMVLKGVSGPISRNTIIDNDSAGIRLIYPVDMGGGDLNGEGNNIIRNNGFYDLVIDYVPQQPETIYVMYSGWDHITLPEILQYDIFNEGGSQNIIINATGFYTDIEEEEQVVSSFQLEQNYPNPFNPSTTISWQSPVGSWQTLKVFDVLGNEVATLVDEYRPAATYEVKFNVATSPDLSLPSGVYFYQLKADEYNRTMKMLLIR